MAEDPNKSIIFILGGLNYGGAERVASHLINHWHSTGRNVTLICRRGSENDFYSIPGDLKRINIGGEGPSGNKIIALFKNMPYVWKLRKAIKRIDSPIVVSFLTKTNIHTILACIGLKRKVVISERNDTTRQKYPWPWPQLRKLLYRLADKVTANSHISLEGMKGYVPEEKLTLVSNPVFIPTEKAVPDQSRVILNVGRLVPQKQQQLVIEALAKLEEKEISDWTYEILGDGEKEEYLRRTAKKLNLSNHIILHGLVRDTAPYYLKAGIFVLPSVYEGTPNALLEAMAFGLPAVVSDSLPGALEIIKDGVNGLVFSSGDIEDLAEKLKILINNPKKRLELGTQAKESVKQFAPDRVMPVWDALLF